MKVRIVKTGSSGKAVQVVRYFNNKRTIVKHIGTSHSNEDLNELILVAEEWIKDYSGQLSIFPDQNPNSVLLIQHCTFLGVYYTLFYDTISKLQKQIGLDTLSHFLLNDLVCIRILEPASKLRSIELLAQYFGIQHHRQRFYDLAPKWLHIKSDVEVKVVEFAKKYYGFSYDLLFYDVTTLYFETFEDDELRKTGFSKDGKAQQPQILVALMVTKEGFPISYEIFPGNTFEGHTIIPVIKEFIKKHEVKDFTVVADAAMISDANIAALKENNIHYIVGGRLGNINKDLFQIIDTTLNRIDGNIIRTNTDKGFLICSYSNLRYRKDKHEMEKQIEKAKKIIEQPSKNKKVKFTSTENQKIELNQKLIDKTTKLLGIKGYYTDLDESKVSNKTVIERYHELYKIEQAFRITKNDLETRPIFHFKEEPIKLHILICFMALVISKQIELQTTSSIRKFVNDMKLCSDARMLNKMTNKEVLIKSQVSNQVKLYLNKLFPPH